MANALTALGVTRARRIGRCLRFLLIVTHDQDEALTLCDRLAVLNDGRVEQIGTAREVYESPVNRFVADFVGTSNVLDGVAAREIIGRTGMFVVRPERIGVFAPGTDSVSGVRTVEATVAEIIYAGPTTRITADTRHGVTLAATVLTASTWLPPGLNLGSPVTLAWPEKAVHALSIEE